MKGRLSACLLPWFAVLMAAASTVVHGRDCNRNGVEDEEETFAGHSPDCNLNFVPDECEVALAPVGFALRTAAPTASRPSGRPWRTRNRSPRRTWTAMGTWTSSRRLVFRR